jgi:hypothetical protein
VSANPAFSEVLDGLASVSDVTTLLDERDALVVRCDECRRLWPVTRERLEAVWEYDESRDLHRCPVCAHPHPGDPSPASRLHEPIG